MPTDFIDVQLHELSIANIRGGTGLHVWISFTWQRHGYIDDKPLHVCKEHTLQKAIDNHNSREYKLEMYSWIKTTSCYLNIFEHWIYLKCWVHSLGTFIQCDKRKLPLMKSNVQLYLSQVKPKIIRIKHIMRHFHHLSWQYRNLHYNDKIVMRQSYLYNVYPFTWRILIINCQITVLSV